MGEAFIVHRSGGLQLPLEYIVLAHSNDSKLTINRYYAEARFAFENYDTEYDDCYVVLDPDGKWFGVGRTRSPDEAYVSANGGYFTVITTNEQRVEVYQKDSYPLYRVVTQ